MPDFLVGTNAQWNASVDYTEISTIIDELNSLITLGADDTSNFFNNDNGNTLTFYNNQIFSIDTVKSYYSGDLFFKKNTESDSHKNKFNIEKTYNDIPNINDYLDFYKMLHKNYYNLIFYLDFKIQFISQLNMFYNTFFEFNKESNSPLFNTTFIYNSRFKCKTITTTTSQDVTDPVTGLTTTQDVPTTSHELELIDYDNNESCIIEFKLKHVGGNATKIYDISKVESAGGSEILTTIHNNPNGNPMTGTEIVWLERMFVLNGSDVDLSIDATSVTAEFKTDMGAFKQKIYNSATDSASSGFTCSTYIYEKYTYLLINSFILYEIFSEYYTQHGTSNGVVNKIQTIIEKFEKVLKNNIISIDKEKRLIQHKDEIKRSRKQLTYSSKKSGILNTQKITNDIHEYNSNIEINIENIEKKNEEIKIKQKKLDNLQIISIIVIVLFVITLLILLFINILNKYKFYEIFSYIFGISIVIFIFTITLYLRNLTNIEGFLIEGFQNLNTIKDEFVSKVIPRLLHIKNTIATLNGLTHCTNIHLDYQDIVSPLIQSEEKKYKNLKKNSELKEKITKFNENITNRDVQYNIKMIEFMLRLLLLIVITIKLIDTFEDYIVLIGIISISIFIILLVIYFIEIIRIVRTKTKTYYWNKPIKEKEVIV